MPSNRTFHTLGVRALDLEHLALANLMYELTESVRAGEQARVLSLLATLTSESREHFAREESAMEEDQYPTLVEHRQGHEHLMAYLDGLFRDVECGSLALDESLIEDLWIWESAHIATEDQLYAEHLLTMGALRKIDERTGHDNRSGPGVSQQADRSSSSVEGLDESYSPAPSELVGEGPELR